MMRGAIERPTADKADHWHRRLLRTRGVRPRCRDTADCTEKFTPPHGRSWLNRHYRIGSNEHFDRAETSFATAT
jgi:hypothetical protein